MADPKVRWHLGVDDQVSRAIRGIDTQLSGLTRSFRTLGGFVGFAAVTAGLTRLVSTAVDLADSLQDASEKLGVSASALQRLKEAGESTGASFETIQSSLVFLAKTTNEAASGGKEAQQAFKALGIDAAKLADIPLDRRLAVIAAQLVQLPPGADRVALAVQVLGKSAADLVPLLGNLDGELGKVAATMSDDQVAALAEAKDAWERLENQIISISAGPMTGFLNIVNDTIEGILAIHDLFKKATGATGSWATGATGSWGEPTNKPNLSDREQAAITGAPKVGPVLSAPDKVKVEVAKDIWHTSLQGTRGLAMLAESAADWNDQLDAQARILGEIETPIETYRKALEQITQLETEGLLNQDQVTAAKKNAYEELAATAEKTAVVVDDKTTQILRSIKNATEGFASDITDIFFDTTQSIGEMFANLAEQIAKTFLQQAVIQPWLDAIFGVLGGLGGGPQEFDMSKIPARRALGGPVSAGSPYFVGESGPELFVPHTSGTVMPNGAGMGGVHVSFNLSSPDPRAAMSILMANERTIVAIVNKAMQRAGRMPELAG